MEYTASKKREVYRSLLKKKKLKNQPSIRVLSNVGEETTALYFKIFQDFLRNSDLALLS